MSVCRCTASALSRRRSFRQHSAAHLKSPAQTSKSMVLPGSPEEMLLRRSGRAEPSENPTGGAACGMGDFFPLPRGGDSGDSTRYAFTEPAFRGPEIAWERTWILSEFGKNGFPGRNRSPARRTCPPVRRSCGIDVPLAVRPQTFKEIKKAPVSAGAFLSLAVCYRRVGIRVRTSSRSSLRRL